MSTNLLSNVGLIFNVCEKSPRNTKVTGTITGAVPWPIKSVFPELNRPPRYRTRHRNGRCTFPTQPFSSPPSSSRPLPPPSSSSSSSLLLLLRPPHPFPPPPHSSSLSLLLLLLPSHPSVFCSRSHRLSLPPPQASLLLHYRHCFPSPAPLDLVGPPIPPPRRQSPKQFDCCVFIKGIPNNTPRPPPTPPAANFATDCAIVRRRDDDARAAPSVVRDEDLSVAAAPPPSFPYGATTMARRPSRPTTTTTTTTKDRSECDDNRLRQHRASRFRHHRSRPCLPPRIRSTQSILPLLPSRCVIFLADHFSFTFFSYDSLHYS